jgi:hypothetical protein
MLGMYRGLYILNWIYRYHTESFFDPIAVVAGIVQTVLYIDFFYLYVTKGLWTSYDVRAEWEYCLEKFSLGLKS